MRKRWGGDANIIYIKYSRLFPFCTCLFCTLLSCSILFYSILFYSILFYSILFYSILFYSILSRIFHWFCMWKTDPMSGFGFLLVFTLPPMETVHCSTKEEYASEITFLALKPWLNQCKLHEVLKSWNLVFAQT